HLYGQLGAGRPSGSIQARFPVGRKHDPLCGQSFDIPADGTLGSVQDPSHLPKRTVCLGSLRGDIMKRIHSNYMELKFPSRSENESFARVAVASFVSQLDPTMEELTDIKTVVSEAVTNAVIHGYEEKED